MTDSGKEAEIILPPPSDKNPIPSLSAALRVDNQEQLLGLLLDIPEDHVAGFRQFLVFSSEQLRTMLMRQVLSDPHTRKWNNPHKNWDDDAQFPGLPKSLNVVGTGVLGECAFNEVGSPDVITYFMRSTDMAQTEMASDFVLSIKTSFHRIVYLPQTPAMTHKILGDMGILKLRRVSLHSLQLDLFPIEADLISMEFSDAVREQAVEGTPSSVLADTARAILKLQDIVGMIPRIQAYGAMAEEVVKKALNLSVEEYLADPVAEESFSENVSALVVIDRRIDLVTPLLTPLTYEGLLDDVLGIDCGFLHLDVDLINSSEEGGENHETVALGINESDTLFSDIRNQHVEKFGSYLQNQARQLEKTKKDFSETGRDKPLPELQRFVRQLPNLQQTTRSLTNHVNLAELVKKSSEQQVFRERWHMERAMIEGDSCFDDLDDMVASQYDPVRFLRLLCLQSLCKNGISASRYDSLRRDIVQTYGYEYLFILSNLEKAGLLRRKEAFLGMDKPSQFSRLKDLLVLIVPDVDTVEPDDISYVSSGYAPLTVRLIQSAAAGWKNGRDEILREIPGRFVDINQQYPPEDLPATQKKPVYTGTSFGSLALENTGGKKPILIVWYVGGVTHMELAALRFLSRKPTFPYNIVCCTTKVINGTTLMQSLQYSDTATP